MRLVKRDVINFGAFMPKCRTRPEATRNSKGQPLEETLFFSVLSFTSMHPVLKPDDVNLQGVNLRPDDSVTSIRIVKTANAVLEFL